MKRNTRKMGFFSFLFGLMGLCAAVFGVYLALSNRDAGPVLVEQPAAAGVRVQTMMDALVAGDYETVSGCLYGNPSLGLDRAAEGDVGQMFWEALAASFRWEKKGDFHATASGVSLDVTITAMDLNSVTENLRLRSQTLLEQRVQQAENVSEIYDENNEYKEAFVMAVLYDAAREALEQDAREISWDLTMNLIYENGQWWIMPEPALLQAISGGILK